MKVLIFAGFLIVYLLYLFVAFYLISKLSKNVKKANFFNDLLITVITTTFLFMFIFIIGKFFDLKLLLFTIAALSLGLILTYAIYALIGSPRVPFRAIGAWAGSNIGMEYPIGAKIFQIIATTITIIYPIAIGIIFFNSSYPIEQTRVLAFKFTIILALSNFIISTPVSFGVLTAGYIDEDTRARYLLGILTSIISLAIYISLLFWLYNIDEKGTELLNIGDITFVYSPLITIFLMAFLLLFIVLPYAIGYNKSKRLAKEFLSSSKRLLKKINASFELASIDNIRSNITECKVFISGRFEKLEDENIGISLGLELDNEEIAKTADAQLIDRWYQVAKSYDKRFVFYNWLDDIYRKLGAFENELSDQLENEEKQETVKRYTSYFISRHKDLVEEGKAEKSNHKLWIGLFAILSPILGVLISEIGKVIVNFFKELI